MKTILSIRDSKTAVMRTLYTDVMSSEFFEASYEFPKAGIGEIDVRRSPLSAMSIFSFRSSIEMACRRSRQDIRRNRANTLTLWFLLRGKLVCDRSSGQYIAQNGDLVLHDSDQEYVARVLPDSTGSFEALQVRIPTHIYEEYMMIEPHVPFSLTNDGIKQFTRIESIISDLEDGADPELYHHLYMSLIKIVIAYVAKYQPRKEKQKLSVRWMDIINSRITKNISNYQITSADIARECHISPRHLFHILRENGTSYRELIWNARLEKSRNWLRDEHFDSHRIQEIAFMSGFKSLSHFSRTFKSRYGLSPRQYRCNKLGYNSNIN